MEMPTLWRLRLPRGSSRKHPMSRPSPRRAPVHNARAALARIRYPIIRWSLPPREPHVLRDPGDLAPPHHLPPPFLRLRTTMCRRKMRRRMSADYRYRPPRRPVAEVVWVS